MHCHFFFSSLSLFIKVIHNLLNIRKKEQVRSKQHLTLGRTDACVVRENSKSWKNSLPTRCAQPRLLLPWKGFSMRVSTQGGKVSLDFHQVGGTRNWHRPVLQRAVPAYPSTVANCTWISVAQKCVIMCISEFWIPKTLDILSATPMLKSHGSPVPNQVQIYRRWGSKGAVAPPW